MRRTIDYLNTLSLSKENYVIVGCSGGPDSMCLLDVLYKENYKIICAHVNHNIRPESISEYQFLEDYCQKKGIIFEGLELEKIDENEDYYRKKRYAFYKDLANKYGTKIIMTAHHGDDLVETILMRISRGSNLKGYLGFRKQYEEDGFTIIKPLIFYNKEEILEYDKKNDIPYVLDKSNDEDDYTRNRYRHYVLGFLKKENLQIQKKYLKFSEKIEETVKFVEKLVDHALDHNYEDGTIDLKLFFEEDPYIQKRELESILKKMYSSEISLVKDVHVEAILKNLKNARNFELCLPKNLIVKRQYNRLIFGVPKKRFKPYKMELKRENILPNGDIIRMIDPTDDSSNFTTRLSSEEVEVPLFIRTRNQGDMIEIKNLNGSKKVNKIFIDEKIPECERDAHPIVVDSDGQIVWIPGVRKSKFDINKDGKYDIILKYIKGKEKNYEKKQPK